MPVPTSFKLPNGLTVLVNERPACRSFPRASSCKTGSGANPVDKPGLANFTAAMLDEGTASAIALQIADEVAQLGGSLHDLVDDGRVAGRRPARSSGRSPTC